MTASNAHRHRLRRLEDQQADPHGDDDREEAERWRTAWNEAVESLLSTMAPVHIVGMAKDREEYDDSAPWRPWSRLRDEINTRIALKVACAPGEVPWYPDSPLALVPAVAEAILAGPPNLRSTGLCCAACGYLLPCAGEMVDIVRDHDGSWHFRDTRESCPEPLYPNSGPHSRWRNIILFSACPLCECDELVTNDERPGASEGAGVTFPSGARGAGGDPSLPPRRRPHTAAAIANAVAEFEAGLLEPADRYPDDPVGFIQERLRELLWSKQVEIAEAIPHHRRVAVQSSHGTGKSWLAARIVVWWLSEHEPGDAFVVTTATTGSQVRAILWREIGRAHAKGRLLGRVTQTEWWMQAGGREEIVAFGRKPSDYDPAAFQGIHARYVLVVIDEPAGVPEAIFDAAKTLTTNEDSRILAIGNPDDPASYFCAKVLKPDSGWHVIHIDGLKSPNFTDEKIPDDLRSLLLSPVWVEEVRRDWGEGSPLWQSKVRGLVPEDTQDGVIPLSWLRRCQEEREWELEQLLPVELGVDVGAGGDWTVARERRGVKVGRVWRARTPEPQQATGLIMEAIRETGATSVKVDAIGIGWGIVGMLEEALAGKGPTIHAVNVGQAALNPERFPKLRDQFWWELGRELSQAGGWDLADLDDTTLAQLIAPKYRLDASGRVKIEPKEDTRKRLGRSPDDADALLLAYYEPPPEPVEGMLVYDEPVAISPF